MTPEGRLTVLGIAGSLRHLSYNRGLIEAARELAPASLAIQAFDLAPIPLYNADVQAQDDPASVRELKAVRGLLEALAEWTTRLRVK